MKVVVRRLPSSMSREAFEDVLGRLDQPGARLLYFVPGFSKSRGRVSSGRAYLSTPSARAAEQFHAVFSRRWPEFEIASRTVPSVEPAAFQRMPRGGERDDAAAGTLESYGPFQEFVRETQREKVFLPGADVQMERRAAAGVASGGGGGEKKEPVISPLLKDMMEKKMAQIERERAQLARNGPKVVVQRGGKQGGGGGANKSSANSSANGNGKKKRGPRRQGRRRGGKKTGAAAAAANE